MTIEIIIALVGLFSGFLLNIIAFTVYISKQNSRIKVCEDSVKVLFDNDKLHSSEIKILYEIKGQLELLIMQSKSSN
ncbi:hypothetical protein [Sulfurimonas sp.]|uniref:hypothetical protein n=1 Tax=Sulfurimonas sp. TaxID=2022749 RepID=UPI0035636379